mmetsp:Transcript_20126/g.38163  ORF Transcript_20126/g.38163 Transcript_20126/m.38163 type:complete len:203 (+) Transcript_20126:115-723(+)
MVDFLLILYLRNAPRRDRRRVRQRLFWQLARSTTPTLTSGTATHHTGNRNIVEFKATMMIRICDRNPSRHPAGQIKNSLPVPLDFTANTNTCMRATATLMGTECKSYLEVKKEESRNPGAVLTGMLTHKLRARNTGMPMVREGTKIGMMSNRCIQSSCKVRCVKVLMRTDHGTPTTVPDTVIETQSFATTRAHRLRLTRTTK